eukprot:SAG11_NODE_12619_length_694_cov_1.026891_1_plen_153_part_10
MSLDRNLVSSAAVRRLSKGGVNLSTRASPAQQPLYAPDQSFGFGEASEGFDATASKHRSTPLAARNHSPSAGQRGSSRRRPQTPSSSPSPNQSQSPSPSDISSRSAASHSPYDDSDDSGGRYSPGFPGNSSGGAPRFTMARSPPQGGPLGLTL